MAISILPPNTPLLQIDRNGNFTGNIAQEWYRYFVNLTKQSDTAAAGEVVAGTGLDGGGFVADGVTIGIEPGGVGNTELRDSAGTSVIGRATAGTGDPADIVAGADNRVLTREGGSLAFRANIEGVTLGSSTPAAVRCTTLRVDTAPAASTAVANNSVAINVNGSVFYMLLSTTP